LKKYTAVVIGLGKIGMQYSFDKKRGLSSSHVSAIKNNKHFELISVCDPDKKLQTVFQKKFGNKIKILNNHLQLLHYLKNNKIFCNLYVIATPSETHAKIIRDIISTQKSQKQSSIIFCEKPLTETSDVGKRLKKLVKNSNFQVVVNHSRRWSKTWQRAFFFKKQIGKIQKAAFFFSTSPENILLDQMRDGIHIGDLLHWFNIGSKTVVTRLNTSYFVYDFHMWGVLGKIEVLDYGTSFKLYKKQKSKKFLGFEELKLIKSEKISESILKNSYDEFIQFFNGKRKNLSTNISDAIDALEVYKKYVYDPTIS